jgi:hypothetical protein
MLSACPAAVADVGCVECCAAAAGTTAKLSKAPQLSAVKVAGIHDAFDAVAAADVGEPPSNIWTALSNGQLPRLQP